jgi:hypothetical protein
VDDLDESLNFKYDAKKIGVELELNIKISLIGNLLQYDCENNHLNWTCG